MNDERPFERLAAHAGPADLDPGFDDSLYALLQGEMRRTVRPSRLTLLLVATVLLALALGGAVLVGSGIVDPPVVPGSSTRLAYALDGDMYLADSGGENPIRIADGASEGSAVCGGARGDGSMWSPDGRYVAYRSSGTDTCSEAIFINDADGRPVASFPGGGWLVSWSPDSTRVATWVDDMRTIGIFGIDGVRQARLPVPSGCADPGDFDPVWSPDGLSIVVTPCEVPINGDPPRRLAEDDPRSHGGRAYSPDGTLVAYASGDSLVIAEAEGGELRVVTGTPAATVGFVYPPNLAWSPSGDRVAFTWSPLDSSGYTKPSGFELRVVDVSTGDVTTLAAEPGIVPIRFSADGDRILVSMHDDNLVGTGLWSLQAGDGSDQRLLVSGTDWGDWQPSPTSLDPSPSVAPSPVDPAAVPSAAVLPAGTYYLANPYTDTDYQELNCERGCSDYKSIVFTLPAGWSIDNGLVSKNGGEREVAFSAWTPDLAYEDPCHWTASALGPIEVHDSSAGTDVVRGAGDMVMRADAPFLNQVGRTASPPTPEQIGGQSALRVEFSVPTELDLATCDGGQFRRWTVWDTVDGADAHFAPGQVDAVYLVDVDRRLLIIDASHGPGASGADVAELDAILASMVIDR